MHVYTHVISYIPLGILYPSTTTSSDVSFPIIGTTGCNLSVSLIHIPRYSSLDKSCLNTSHQHTYSRYVHTALIKFFEGCIFCKCHKFSIFTILFFKITSLIFQEISRTTILMACTSFAKQQNLHPSKICTSIVL